MKHWWLILRNKFVIGAANSEGEAAMKIEHFIARLPFDFRREGNKWTSLGDTYEIVEVEEINAR